MMGFPRRFTLALASLTAGVLLQSCSYDTMTAPYGDQGAFGNGRIPSGEEYATIVENRFIAAADEPTSTFAVDVDAASYSNVRRFLRDNSKPPADAVRVEELINYFEYDYPQPMGDVPFSVTTEVAECPWNPEHRLVQIALQGKEMQLEQLPPSNLTFLIDVSGSMASADKLPLLKKAFRMLIDQLTARDRVAIVVYAGAAGVVLPSTPGSERETIAAAIENLEAGGSTAGAEGIVGAYTIAQQNFIAGGNNRVILATDGDFNVGISNNEELVRLIEQKRESGVFLTVLGFGTGNLKDARMEQLADHGNGHYAYIDGEMEAKKVFLTEIGATLFTIAKDVKVQVVFNATKVKEYRLIGYENRLLANEDFDNDAKDAGDIGAGHSVTALYEIIPGVGGVQTTGNGLDTLNLPGEFWSNQLVQIRLRYKEPSGSTSLLLTHGAVDRGASATSASSDFRFAAAVAEFGMQLRDSKYVGSGSYDQVESLAQGALGADLLGYRRGFLELVELARRVDP
jgi:Ca-activated chloride channel homolog